MRALALACVFALTTCAFAAAARPAQPHHVELHVAPCPGGPTSEEVRAALSLELTDLGARILLSTLRPSSATSTLAPGSATPRITVRWPDCDLARVELTLEDPLSATHTRRAIELGEVEPGLRVQTITLASAELYRAIVFDPPDPPEPPAPSTPAPPAPTPPPSSPTPPPIPALHRDALVTLTLTHTTLNDVVLLGAELAVASPSLGSTPLALYAALGAATGDHTTSPGDISTTALRLGLGLDLVAGGPEHTFVLGVRLGLGLVALSGDTASDLLVGTSGFAPQVDLGLAAELRWRITSALVGIAHTGLGGSLIGAEARAPTTPLASTHGPRVHLAIGLGLTL